MFDRLADSIFNLLQGRVSIADIIGTGGSETACSKPDGSFQN